MAALWWLLAPPLAHFMTDDPTVQKWLILYLRIVPAGYCFQGIYRLSTGMMNGMDQATLSTTVNTLRMIAFYIPLAWGFGQIWQVTKPMSSILSAGGRECNQWTAGAAGGVRIPLGSGTPCRSVGHAGRRKRCAASLSL